MLIIFYYIQIFRYMPLFIGIPEGSRGLISPKPQSVRNYTKTESVYNYIHIKCTEKKDKKLKYSFIGPSEGLA